MRKLLYVLLIALCWGCPHPDAATAVAVHGVLDQVLVQLLEQYDREGMKAIQIATSRDEAEALVAAVDLRWAPTWAAWEGLRVQFNSWAEELEDGEAPKDPQAVLKAWCTLHEELERLGSVPHVLNMVAYECSK